MHVAQYTDKKENEIFLKYKEIQMGSVAKSYIGEGFLICEEVRRYLSIYEVVVSYTCNRSLLSFLIHGENLIFFFISVGHNNVDLFLRNEET